jgi:hypothetical protein
MSHLEILVFPKRLSPCVLDLALANGWYAPELLCYGQFRDGLRELDATRH